MELHTLLTKRFVTASNSIARVYIILCLMVIHQFTVFINRQCEMTQEISKPIDRKTLIDSVGFLLNLALITDRDSDGYNVFTIDPTTGMIRTKAVLDHEERNVYRVSIKASDAGRPPRHSVRALRVEVLALADNRPTFTSSSLTFRVRIHPSILEAPVPEPEPNVIP